jgi:hypothetical protein
MVSCSGGTIGKVTAYFGGGCNSYVIERNDGYASNSKQEGFRNGAAHGLLREIAEGAPFLAAFCEKWGL